MKWLLALIPTLAFAGVIGDPYTGTPIQISSMPGAVTIWEAEDFDKGGEGVAYHKIVLGGNVISVYRPLEDVNIMRSPDAAYGGGYTVFKFMVGEWLAYTIQVSASALYKVGIRAAAGDGPGGYHVELDGMNVDPLAKSIVIDKTQDWSTYAWTESTEFAISPGRHILKIFADQWPFHLNAIRLKYSSDVGWDCKPVIRKFP